MKIGIDIEKISRFKLPKGSAFIRKLFSSAEIAYAYAKSRPEVHLCGMFCAKEAVKKTLGDKIKITMREIEIRHKENGEPAARIKKEKSLFLLSISHSGGYGVASALKLKDEKP